LTRHKQHIHRYQKRAGKPAQSKVGTKKSRRRAPNPPPSASLDRLDRMKTLSLTEKEPEDSELVPFTPALFGLWPAPDKSVDLVSLPPQLQKKAGTDFYGICIDFVKTGIDLLL
ncbi:hypothetical protein H0H92_016066, partial [Tricholoma furcatifolium]